MGIPLLTSLKTSVLRKGGFVANVLTLMTGATLSQILIIAIAPILTRLYTPQDFGVFALFITISSILLLIASWRYEMAIMLPEEHEDAANVFALAVSILLVMSGLALIMVLLLRQPIANLLKTPQMASWLFWIPVNIFLLGLSQIFNYWHSRMKNFSQLAVSRVIAATVYAGTQIGIGIWGHYGPIGLIVGQLVGSFMDAGILGCLILKKDLKLFKNTISRKNIIHQAFIYYRFPLIESWSVIAWLASQKIPILLLNYFFNNVIVGLYFVGYRALNLPLQFINASLSQVFYQRYEEKRKSIGKKEFLKKMIRSLAIVSLIPTVMLLLFAPMIFRVLFGAEWEVAGEYVRILTPLLFFRFISGPTSSVFWSESKNFLRLILVTMLLITSILAFYIGGLLGNIYTALIIYSICGSILNLFNIVIVLRVASK